MLQRLIPIRLEQVTYRIGAKPLVEDLSFEVGPAETVVLLGRGGSGKTTTLRLING
jgi:ABC-type multidrug transport system ATPase subunit